MKKIRNNIYVYLLALFSLILFLVNARINIFSYNNFDFGKFDLGNMTQMIWNTLHGRTLYLTDYFGTNLPRWSMSHVDPILLLFVPIFALFQHPLTLVFSQLVLVITSVFIIYRIALLKFESKFNAFLLSISYLFYPAVGFITARTAFHGVTVVIPFFLGAFYLYESMYVHNKYPLKKIVLFWILLILCMAGKEQIPLYIFMYGVFILLFRNPLITENNVINVSKANFKNLVNHISFKMFVSISVVSILWFYIAFFVIIPKYAHYRVDGFNAFAASLDINTNSARDVDLDNYFLSRYDLFGDSYTDVIVNVIFNPKKVIKVFFGGDKLENLNMTFEPVAYMPFLAPQLLIIALPDFLINYLTTAGGIGTAEIRNHRISMIIPVLFISSIYGIAFVNSLIFKNKGNKKKYLLYSSILPFVFLFFNVKTSFSYENPVYLWLSQSVQKRLPSFIAMAKYDATGLNQRDLKIGEIVRLNELEHKDRECAQKITSMIPVSASVSGPDYLGAHLSMRETYAIFPALHNEADFVIVDVFSKKILDILDVNTTLLHDVVEALIKNNNYKLLVGCGNLFVFQKVPTYAQVSKPLPIQERFDYDEKYDFPIHAGLNLVDYRMPSVFSRTNNENVQFVYKNTQDASLDGYIMFMSFVNAATGEIYQAANLPSFGILQPSEWQEDVYYIEDVELAMPQYLDEGAYKVFIGLGNKIRTRSIYLGEVVLK